MGGVLKPQVYTHYKECSPQCIEKVRFASDAPIDEKSQKHPGGQKRFCTCPEEDEPIGHVQTGKMKKNSSKIRELRMISFKGGGSLEPKIAPIMGNGPYIKNVKSKMIRTP